MDALISTPIPMRYLDAVENGIEFLDSKHPSWLGAIDLTTLDLGDVESCVLGQVFGDYEAGLYELGIDDPFGLGFTLHEEHELELALDNGSTDSTDTILGNRFAMLTEAWIAKLRVRLGQYNEAHTFVYVRSFHAWMHGFNALGKHYLIGQMGPIRDPQILEYFELGFVWKEGM